MFSARGFTFGIIANVAAGTASNCDVKSQYDSRQPVVIIPKNQSSSDRYWHHGLRHVPQNSSFGEPPSTTAGLGQLTIVTAVGRCDRELSTDSLPANCALATHSVVGSDVRPTSVDKSNRSVNFCPDVLGEIRRVTSSPTASNAHKDVVTGIDIKLEPDEGEHGSVNIATRTKSVGGSRKSTRRPQETRDVYSSRAARNGLVENEFEMKLWDVKHIYCHDEKPAMDDLVQCSSKQEVDTLQERATLPKVQPMYATNAIGQEVPRLTLQVKQGQVRQEAGETFCHGATNRSLMSAAITRKVRPAIGDEVMQTASQCSTKSYVSRCNDLVQVTTTSSEQMKNSARVTNKKPPEDCIESHWMRQRSSDVCEMVAGVLGIVLPNQGSHTEPKNLKATKQSYACLECARSFNSRGNLWVHRKTKHSDDAPYECSICHRRFKMNFDLQRHKFSHEDRLPFQCDECDRSFRSKQSLVEHKSVHRGPELVSCPTCGKICNSLPKLKRHRRIHRPPKVCTTCGKEFRDRISFRNHELQHNAGERPFVCETCGKRFYVKKRLRLHAKMHSDEPKYDCKVCGKRFAQDYALYYHKTTHVERVYHTCTTCGKDYVSKKAFKKHSRLHAAQSDRTSVCQVVHVTRAVDVSRVVPSSTINT